MTEYDVRRASGIATMLAFTLAVAGAGGCAVADPGEAAGELAQEVATAGSPAPHIYPTRQAAQRSSAVADATANGIDYHGGPVMLGTTNIYYLWYGNWAGNTAPAILNDFGNAIGGTPYYGINTSYYETAGQFVFNVSNSVSVFTQTFDNYSRGTNLTDSDIQQLVASAIGRNFPSDSNGVYFVLTSADVSQTGANNLSFCANYCGWHNHANIGGADIKYAFVGNADRCPSSCAAQSIGPNGNAGADAMVSTVAHELEEAVTDPDLNAWFSSNQDENADKCVWTFGTQYRTANGASANMRLHGRDFLVQRNWLNANGGRCTLSYVPNPAPGPNIVLQRSVDTLLWNQAFDGGAQRIGNGLGMESGTDVSVAALYGGGYEAAWNGGGGQLWTLGPDNIGRFTGYIMSPGTSPAIAGMTTGGAQIVFQNASDGLLWTIAPDGTATRVGNGLGIQSGTRIGLTALVGGTYEIAWNGGGGQLWTLGPDNIGRFTGQMMTPGASPAVTGLPTGSAQIVFQKATDNLLWTMGPSGSAARIGNGLGIQSGTRPSIAALAGGGYEIAWNGGGGQLWILGPDNIGRFTGFGMRSDASPTIAALRTGGAEVAFTSNTGFLWTLGADGAAHATALDVQPNTNPAITPLQ